MFRSGILPRAPHPGTGESAARSEESPRPWAPKDFTTPAPTATRSEPKTVDSAAPRAPRTPPHTPSPTSPSSQAHSPGLGFQTRSHRTARTAPQNPTAHQHVRHPTTSPCPTSDILITTQDTNSRAVSYITQVSATNLHRVQILFFGCCGATHDILDGDEVFDIRCQRVELPGDSVKRPVTESCRGAVRPVGGLGPPGTVRPLPSAPHKSTECPLDSIIDQIMSLPA